MQPKPRGYETSPPHPQSHTASPTKQGQALLSLQKVQGQVSTYSGFPRATATPSTGIVPTLEAPGEFICPRLDRLC